MRVRVCVCWHVLGETGAKELRINKEIKEKVSDLDSKVRVSRASFDGSWKCDFSQVTQHL